MKILLDTHAFLWLVGDRDLSDPARDAYLDTENQIWFSAASYWEICIKASLGKLTLLPDWPQRFDDELAGNGIRWLPIEKSHCQQLSTLPFYNRDPFDRTLIAQALVEQMTIMTTDAQIRQYPVTTLW